MQLAATLTRLGALAARASRFWAIGAVLAVGASAYWALGPFAPTPAASSDLLTSLFGDRIVVGAVRVVVISAALYIVASLAALIAEGRWINEIGSGGAKIDAAKKKGSAALATLTAELAAAKALSERNAVIATRAVELSEQAAEGAVVLKNRLDEVTAERDAIISRLVSQGWSEGLAPPLEDATEQPALPGLDSDPNIGWE